MISFPPDGSGRMPAVAAFEHPPRTLSSSQNQCSKQVCATTPQSLQRIRWVMMKTWTPKPWKTGNQDAPSGSGRAVPERRSKFFRSAGNLPGSDHGRESSLRVAAFLTRGDRSSDSGCNRLSANCRCGIARILRRFRSGWKPIWREIVSRLQSLSATAGAGSAQCGVDVR
jgi:hypothetical protein